MGAGAKKLSIRIHRKTMAQVAPQDNANPPAAQEPGINGLSRTLQETGLTMGNDQVPDKAKCLLPFSPALKRTPKRHTSATYPPYCTPANRSQYTMRDRETSPSPRSMHNASCTQGTLAMSNDPFRGESTLVGDASWDSILSGSPHLSQDEGESTPSGIVGSHPQGTTVHTRPVGQEPPPLHFTPVNSPLHSSPLDENRAGTPSDRSMVATLTIQSMQPHNIPQIECEIVENNIITNNKGLRRTAMPNGGWPEIHLQLSPWDNVKDAQIEAWNEVTSAKLWACTFRGKYENNSLVMVDKTQEVIRSLIDIEKMALGVSFPIQKQQIDGKRFPTPYHMLISGLTKEEASLLSGLEVVSTPDITLLFKPFKEQCLMFITTICGFTFKNTDDIQPIVTDIIKKRFAESKEIIAHIMEVSLLPLDRTMSEILESILVKYIKVKRSPTNGGDFWGWNVYLHNSCLTDNDHVKLIKIMRACKFPTATSGFGISLCGKDTLLCVNCKLIDHDTPNCLFPNFLGWLGHKPPPQSTSGQRQAYNDELQGGDPAPFRGRGRGRGNRGRGQARPSRGGGYYN